MNPAVFARMLCRPATTGRVPPSCRAGICASAATSAVPTAIEAVTPSITSRRRGIPVLSLGWVPFELEQANGVSVWVGEPGGVGESDVGDAVDGVQIGQIFDLDAAAAQVCDLGGQVADPPGGFGGRIGRAGAALGDHQSAVAAAAEGDEL